MGLLSSPLIGARNDNKDEEFLGYIDEVRATNGIGRYPSSYTVPTEPFPNP